MSSIFIDTLTYRVKNLNGHYFIGKASNNEYPAFDTAEKKIYASEFLLSLLLHDTIFINIDSLEEVILLLGIDSTLFLLRERILIVIDDGGTRVAFMPNGDMNLLMNFSNCSEFNFDNILHRLLEKYKGNFKRQLIKPLVFAADNASVKMDGAWQGHLVTDEVISDFENKRVVEYLGFKNDYSNVIVKDEDVNPTFRLSYVNKSLIYQHTLNIDCLLTESAAKQIINLKLGPYLSSTLANPTGLFQEILKDKQIPDFTAFFLEGILTIEEIVAMRESVDGKKFRNWLESEDYNKEEVYKKMLSSLKNKGDNLLVRVIRFALTNIIGVASTSIGLGVSAVDSFIIDKFLKGWHPNLFLDDVLSKKLDKIQENNSVSIRQQKEERIFGRKIQRNETCPCGSMKKYKNCCGS